MAQASTLVPLQSIIVPELTKSRGKPNDSASVHAGAVYKNIANFTHKLLAKTIFKILWIFGPHF